MNYTPFIAARRMHAIFDAPLKFGGHTISFASKLGEKKRIVDGVAVANQIACKLKPNTLHWPLDILITGHTNYPPARITTTFLDHSISLNVNFLLFFLPCLYNLCFDFFKCSSPPTQTVPQRVLPIDLNVSKDCLQLDTKLVCDQCKALQCECPAGVEKRSIRSLPEIATLTATDCRISSAATTLLTADNRTCSSRKAAAPDNDDRPAAIRLASILGIRRGTAQDSGSSSRAVSATPQAFTQAENVTNSPATTWFKDKYQMATNKLMSSKV